MANTEHFRNAAAGDTSDYIRNMVGNDGVRSNLCGRGVRTTLQALGIPTLTPEQTGAQDGHRWDEILTDPRMKAAGWEEVDWSQMGWSPENSPPGIVWVYGHNEPRPDTNVDKTGRAFGHVEISLEDGYVAGGFANNPGGSVRHNAPRAFVHPELTELFSSEGPVPEEFARASVERAVETVTEETRRREGDTAAEVYRQSIQRDVSQIDFAGMDLMGFLEMLLKILTGQPLDAPTVYRDNNGSGPEVDRPDIPEESPDPDGPTQDQPDQPPVDPVGDGQQQDTPDGTVDGSVPDVPPVP